MVIPRSSRKRGQPGQQLAWIFKYYLLGHRAKTTTSSGNNESSRKERPNTHKEHLSIIGGAAKISQKLKKIEVLQAPGP
jgi:hypothetical protein